MENNERARLKEKLKTLFSFMAKVAKVFALKTLIIALISLFTTLYLSYLFIGWCECSSIASGFTVILLAIPFAFFFYVYGLFDSVAKLPERFEEAKIDFSQLKEESRQKLESFKESEKKVTFSGFVSAIKLLWKSYDLFDGANEMQESLRALFWLSTPIFMLLGTVALSLLGVEVLAALVTLVF